MTIQVKVEVAFADSPLDPTPTWTDISGYVLLSEGITIKRGREDQFADIQTGTADLVLNNSDGRFTPERTASPYYPNVRLRRRVRIQVTHDGSTWFTRFTGFVKEWPVQWAPTGRFSQAAITLTDGTIFLGQAEQLSDLVTNVIDRLEPIHHWTLGDPEGTTAAANGVDPSHPLRAQGSTVTFGTATGPPFDSLTAMNTTGSGWAEVRKTAGDPLFAFDGDWTVVMFYLVPSIPSSARPLYALISDTGVAYGHYIKTNGKLENINFGLEPPTGPVVADNTTRFVGHVHIGADERPIIYYDDVVSDPGNGYENGIMNATTGLFSTEIVALQLAHDSADPSLFSNLKLTGTFAHVAIWDRALSATEIAEIKEAGLTGFVGESAGDRAQRLLEWAGLDPAEINVETTTATVGAQDYAGNAPADLVDPVMDTEVGVWFFGKDGEVYVQGRAHRQNRAAVVTLTSDDIEPDLVPILDDFGVANDVTVHRGDETGRWRVRDEAAITDIGPYSRDIEIVADTEEQARDRAYWEVARTAAPKVRWPSLAVDIATLDPSKRTGVMNADISEVVALSSLPSTAATSSVSVMVEGYSETIRIDAHTIQFNASPVYPQDSNVLVLDDNTYGLLDSNYLGL